MRRSDKKKLLEEEGLRVKPADKHRGEYVAPYKRVNSMRQGEIARAKEGTLTYEQRQMRDYLKRKELKAEMQEHGNGKIEDQNGKVKEADEGWV